MAGTLLLQRGFARPLIVGLWLGYLVFGLLFTMHVHTHTCYQAQLVPLVAIAASPVAVLVASACLAARGRALKATAAAAVGVLLAIPAVREWQQDLAHSHEESAQVAREIGELVGHSQRVVYLSPYYGLPLQYLGEFTGAYWPRPITYWLYRKKGERELSVAERLADPRFEPEFWVITAFREFERKHQDLAEYLETRCKLKARTTDYLIYEACRAPEPARPLAAGSMRARPD